MSLAQGLAMQGYNSIFCVALNLAASKLQVLVLCRGSRQAASEIYDAGLIACLAIEGFLRSTG